MSSLFRFVRRAWRERKSWEKYARDHFFLAVFVLVLHDGQSERGTIRCLGNGVKIKNFTFADFRPPCEQSTSSEQSMCTVRRGLPWVQEGFFFRSETGHWPECFEHSLQSISLKNQAHQRKISGSKLNLRRDDYITAQKHTQSFRPFFTGKL